MMFSGVWSWVLAIAIVAVIFGHDKFPQLKKMSGTIGQKGIDLLHKKRKAYEERICKKIVERDGLNKQDKDDCE